MEQNGELPSFILLPPTPLNSAAAEESSAECDVSGMKFERVSPSLTMYGIAKKKPESPMKIFCQIQSTW
jgi:hypothetical protein